MKSRYSDVFEPDALKLRQQANPFCKLNDAVYDIIKSAINAVRFSPGEKLNITEIANTLGVSITPVKNAVQRLMDEGLVEYHNGSYHVFDMNEKGLTDIYDLRICYEGFGAYLCARRLILVDTDSLRRTALEHKRLWLDYADGDNSEENYRARMDEDLRFHDLIMKYSDNSLLYDLYKKERRDIEYALRRYFYYWKIDSGTYGKRLMAEQHLIIVNAISLGIPDVARQAAEEHAQFDKTQCLLRRNRQTDTGYRE